MATRPVKSGQQMADAWVQQMAAAGPAYAAGTAAVQESPMAKAAQNLDKYLASTAQAVSSGRMTAALNAVPLGDWQAACKAKSGNLGQGAQLKKQKFLQAAQKNAQTNQQIRDALASMPSGGTANALARIQKVISMQKAAVGKSD